MSHRRNQRTNFKTSGSKNKKFGSYSKRLYNIVKSLRHYESSLKKKNLSQSMLTLGKLHVQINNHKNLKILEKQQQISPKQNVRRNIIKMRVETNENETKREKKPLKTNQ